MWVCCGKLPDFQYRDRRWFRSNGGLTIALIDALDVEVEMTLCLPEFGVERRFPRIDRIVGQIRELPFSGGEV